MKRAVIMLIIAWLFLGAALAASGDTVYITPKGCCYHLKSCRTIKNSKNLVELTVKEAIERSRRACKICKP